jgi:hypothetical protein
MSIDIVAEAEAVAAARWRATEPPAGGDPPAPRPPEGPSTTARSPDPRPLVHPAARGADADDEADPWVTRQLLRLGDRTLGIVALLAMLALVGTTVLTALAVR